MKVLIEICFDGTRYHGWQVQKNAPSVQKTLQGAVEERLCAPVSVTGCSRTDAGVHAKSFFAALESPALDAFPIERLPLALNVLLPPDIAVKNARAVSADFHPRYDALLKEYEYRISDGPVRDPFEEGRVWTLPGKALNAGVMDRLAQDLVGEHDFTSFCAAGGKTEDKTRKIFRCSVRREGQQVVMRVSANGFLYNMVRIIAGTLVDLSLSGKELLPVLEGRNRALAGRTAPPCGLYLTRVIYGSEELSDYLKTH